MDAFVLLNNCPEVLRTRPTGSFKARRRTCPNHCPYSRRRNSIRLHFTANNFFTFRISHCYDFRTTGIEIKSSKIYDSIEQKVLIYDSVPSYVSLVKNNSSTVFFFGNICAWLLWNACGEAVAPASRHSRWHQAHLFDTSRIFFLLSQKFSQNEIGIQIAWSHNTITSSKYVL